MVDKICWDTYRKQHFTILSSYSISDESSDNSQIPPPVLLTSQSGVDAVVWKVLRIKKKTNFYWERTLKDKIVQLNAWTLLSPTKLNCFHTLPFWFDLLSYLNSTKYSENAIKSSHCRKEMVRILLYSHLLWIKVIGCRIQSLTSEVTLNLWQYTYQFHVTMIIYCWLHLLSLMHYFVLTGSWSSCYRA